MTAVEVPLLRRQAYVDGSWVDADSGETFPVVNPATGETLADVPRMGAEETRRALDAAERALPEWKARTAKERARVLRRLADLMLEREEDLRRHLFAIPEDAAERVDLEAEPSTDGRSLRVTVGNRLPHALPTGQFGRRQLALDVTWPGGSRRTNVVESPARALASGERRRFDLEVPAEALALPLRVSLLRYDHGDGEWSETASAALDPRR